MKIKMIKIFEVSDNCHLEYYDLVSSDFFNVFDNSLRQMLGPQCRPNTSKFTNQSGIKINN